jgi:hypothetical protein
MRPHASVRLPGTQATISHGQKRYLQFSIVIVIPSAAVGVIFLKRPA